MTNGAIIREARLDYSRLGRADFSLCYFLLQTLAWSVVPALFRVRVFGRENVPARGGVLIASNHQSFLDPVFVAVGLARPVNFMAREDLFRGLLFGALIRSLNAFPVKRESGDLAAVRAAVDRLKRGSLLLMFPEGTRSRDGSIGRLKDGFAVVAARADAMVAPVVIEGAHRAWPRGQALFEPRNVWVAFGRPLAPTAATGKERRMFSQKVQCRMKELQDFLRRVRASRFADKGE